MRDVPRPAVFLDRDGTVIEDRHYLHDPAEVRLLPGAAPAIARLNVAGWPVIMVTNQSGIGRGLFTETQYQRVQDRVAALLADNAASLTASYHCPHRPDAIPPCDCRKPLPGLFQRAARQHALDLSRSHYIGDRLRDVEPGGQLGGTGYLLASAPPEEIADRPPAIIVVDSLADAVDRLLS